MKKNKSIDLTSGPILKTLAELALPIMASSLLGTAYNITDMAWIGLLGSKAVAGVGVGGMYVWLSQGLVALPRMADRFIQPRPADGKTMKKPVPMRPVHCRSPFYSDFFLRLSVLYFLIR